VANVNSTPHLSRGRALEWSTRDPFTVPTGACTPAGTSDPDFRLILSKDESKTLTSSHSRKSNNEILDCISFSPDCSCVHQRSLCHLKSNYRKSGCEIWRGGGEIFIFLFIARKILKFIFFSPRTFVIAFRSVEEPFNCEKISSLDLILCHWASL
jgi:hypothetical protein